MIKLNNKNITYVALADSNNSLKAPKEIWYADSNNSVKLVYRRKDALIEGIDYEKYHWLVANTPYGTNIELPLDTANFSFKRIWRDFGNDTLFLSNSKQYVYHAVTKNIYIWSISNNNDIFIGNTNRILNEEIIIYSTDGNLTIGDEEVPQIDYPPSIIRFRNAGTGTTQYSTSVITVDGTKRYIPCKLLKPVPKWLDANGIRRQVGECGMIDLVSGKFYGNVNSVGTFTVENYYERKEWLIGDGSAYIDTGIKLAETDIITSKFITTTTPNNIYHIIYGNDIGGWGGSGCIAYATVVSIRPTYNDTSYTFAYSLNTIYDVEQSSTSIVINNSTVWQGTSVFAYSSSNCMLFSSAKGYSGSHQFNGKISKFNISNKISLIPCTLTMDLPASMDANNIARTKGTSGMWDLVSDRFYGNVANSGTFKAVNLAEGVDYEVHQWLKTEVAVEERRMMQLPVHSYSFSFSRKIISGTNVPYFYTEGGAPTNVYINTTNLHTIKIWNNVQGTYYESGQSFDRNDAISIVSSTDGLVVNSQTIPQNTFPAQAIYFGANDNNGTENYTSSITVDGIERYIPVKLLRPIPSKYDANGIARQAGECGMYDTVNDKFYGNVANSGSFTVEDDS